MAAVTLIKIVMVILFFQNTSLVQRTLMETTFGVCEENKVKATSFNSRHKNHDVSVYVSCFVHPKDKKA